MKKKLLTHYISLMKSAYEKKEWVKVKEYGEEVLSKLSNLESSPSDKYFLYTKLALVYFNLAEYASSLSACHKAKLLVLKYKLSRAEYVFIVYLIGSNFLLLRNFTQALVQFQKVNEYYRRHGDESLPMDKNKYFNTLLSTANCYLYLNKLDEMRAVMDNEASALLPSVAQGFHINYYHLRGSYFLKIHEYEKASQSINEALKIGEQYNLANAVLNAKFMLVYIDLFQNRLDSAIQSLEAVFKEAWRLKSNLYICKIGLFLSRSYALKNLSAKAVSIEKKIKPYFNKLDTLLLYEQTREAEDLYRELQPVYRKEANIPSILSEVLNNRNSAVSDKRRAIIGKSEVMREIAQLVEKIAPTDLPVLIQGETGTGKELIARNIHMNSARGRRPWLALNCASLTETLLENELFGHVKGAFTDAKEDRKGYIESASEGTLFLDEISEMSLPMQQKLLRVLEEKLVWRVGSEKPVPVNTRFIFASNKNMEELVKRNLFRQDLFYRINTIIITLPPLRDRKNDIPLLINHFLKKYASSQSAIRHPPFAIEVTPDALRLLAGYPWPGNIRELENEIKRICTLYPNIQTITGSMLSESIKKGNKAIPQAGANLRELKEGYEKNLIIEALDKHNWNIARAAQQLGCLRPHLSRRIKQLKIVRDKNVTKR